MSPKRCDHTSVGVMVWREGKLLMIERKNFPFGFAPPAGHVDEHGSYEDAARKELQEEVGLLVRRLKLLIEGRKDNHCKREDGTWHFWKVYVATAEGELKRSEDETKQAGWFTKDDLQRLADRTRQYLDGQIPDEEWQAEPGLEPIWFDWLRELKEVT